MFFSLKRKDNRGKFRLNELKNVKLWKKFKQSKYGAFSTVKEILKPWNVTPSLHCIPHFITFVARFCRPPSSFHHHHSFVHLFINHTHSFTNPLSHYTLTLSLRHGLKLLFTNSQTHSLALSLTHAHNHTLIHFLNQMHILTIPCSPVTFTNSFMHSSLPSFTQSLCLSLPSLTSSLNLFTLRSLTPFIRSFTHSHQGHHSLHSLISFTHSLTPFTHSIHSLLSWTPFTSFLFSSPTPFVHSLHLLPSLTSFMHSFHALLLLPPFMDLIICSIHALPSLHTPLLTPFAISFYLLAALP
jgi:hypothetical protein